MTTTSNTAPLPPSGSPSQEAWFSVNGQVKPLGNLRNLTDLLQTLPLWDRFLKAGHRPVGFAVSINGEVIPFGLYAERLLRSGDRIEIIHAVGGG